MLTTTIHEDLLGLTHTEAYYNSVRISKKLFTEIWDEMLGSKSAYGVGISHHSAIFERVCEAMGFQEEKEISK